MLRMSYMKVLYILNGQGNSFFHWAVSMEYKMHLQPAIAEGFVNTGAQRGNWS